jgi:tRNA wybutosine-synthesizing protein 3
MALPPSSSELIPDAIDDVASFLPSFADLRRKNLDALYGDGNDKSPKGYVDIAIRALCDLVNTHPSFVTLSSCSGRIAIFDPKESNNDQVIDEEEGERGGKGRGEWILVSHEPVDPSSIPPLLTHELTGKLIFKHEPLLLHVAASSLTRGRQFLSLALQLGFRESGLVVTPSRVTIAVRSHSLALTVPLAYSGTLRPPDDYLIALVEEANQQMHSNLKKLNRLESEIKRMFFRDESNDHGNEQVHARLRKLPALNLWGHDAVSIPFENGHAKAYVFGGYGSGPNLAGDESGKKRKAGRSNRIYSLQLHVDGAIAKDWEHVEHTEPLSLHSEENVTTWFGVDVSPTTFAPCEGLQVCLLPLELCATNGSGTSPVIAIWGGRSGPSTPFDDLLLFEPEKIPLCFSKPLDVRGDLPSPRWGHTLTPLSGKDGMMAILIGGRDANCSRQDNVHILSLVQAGPKRVFTWIRLSSRIPPQFHHSVIALDDDMILIGGGLTEPNDLTECFSDADMFKKIDSCSKRSSTEKPDPVSTFRVMPNALLEISLPSVTEFVPHYGVGSCCLSHRGSQIISFIGGAPLPGGKLSADARRLENALYPMRWFALEDGAISNYDVHYESCDAEHVSFAAMIHTCCVTLPMPSQFLILGGGVSSFAFGASFAE